MRRPDGDDSSFNKLESQPNTSLLSSINDSDMSFGVPEFYRGSLDKSKVDQTSRPRLKRTSSSLNLFQDAKLDDSSLMPPPSKRQKTSEILECKDVTQEIVIHTGESVRRITARELLDLFKSIKILSSQVALLSSENTKLFSEVTKLKDFNQELMTSIKTLMSDNYTLNLKPDNLFQSLSSGSPFISSSQTSYISKIDQDINSRQMGNSNPENSTTRGNLSL